MLYTDAQDAQLVRMYGGGDEKALETLIRRHKDRLFMFILSKVRDRELAEDVFQDTFLKIINTIRTSRYNEEGKFIQWAMRIAHNLVIDHFRREKKQRKVTPLGEYDFMANIKDDSLTIEAKIIKEQIESKAISLLELLPAEQREVLEMRIYADLSFKDIAEQTGVSINTALGRMRYALINLRKVIAENNIILSQK
ncbi:MAG: sigma-70 family RNA polymerase sigma factor [Flavobacteriales bacterium]|nr:MAG: sigma-70 family RNA polymerase sigma factor [Flavobacteriales bacterium]